MDRVKVIPPRGMTERKGARGESGKEPSSLGGHIDIGCRVFGNILDHDHDTMTVGGMANCAPNVCHDRVVRVMDGDQYRVGPRRAEAKEINLRFPIQAPRGPHDPRGLTEDIGRSKSSGDGLPLQVKLIAQPHPKLEGDLRNYREERGLRTRRDTFMNESSDLVIKMWDAICCLRSLPHILKPPCAIPGETLVWVCMHDAKIGPSRGR